MEGFEKDNIEFNKLQGFDVLEKLPEEKFIDNYNEQFYSTLEGLKLVAWRIFAKEKHYKQEAQIHKIITIDIRNKEIILKNHF